MACFSLLAINYPKTQFYIFPFPIPFEAQYVIILYVYCNLSD